MEFFVLVNQLPCSQYIPPGTRLVLVVGIYNLLWRQEPNFTTIFRPTKGRNLDASGRKNWSLITVDSRDLTSMKPVTPWYKADDVHWLL